MRNWRILFMIGLIVGLAMACTETSNEPTEAPSTTPTRPASSTPSPTPITVNSTPALSTVNLKALRAELDLNRQLWGSMAIERYQFEHRWVCFCIAEFRAPVEITVSGGTIVDVRYIDNESVAGNPDTTRYNTVDGLFDIIQDAIDREAHTISAEYDAELGYPTAVSIDYDSRIADEERGFTDSNLKAVQEIFIDGHWEGVNQIAGQELTIVVDFFTIPDGLSATIDIPLQGSKGLGLSEVRFNGSRVHFELTTPIGVAVWDGVLDGEAISGEFSQADFSGTFQLTKGILPTEPIGEPVPYIVEEVTFANDGITLVGTLSIPPAVGPHPAVILLTGSGAQDRNEEIFGFKIFEKISDRLTRSGMAVLRWDDRGVGGSTGDLSQATLEDLAEDARVAVALLGGREEIDPGRIGVLGHSEGGAVALLVANRADVAFVVLMAGPAVATTELLAEQQRLLLEAAGASKERIAEAIRTQEMLFQAALTDEGWDEAAEAIRLLALASISDLPESDRSQLGDIDELVESIAQEQLAVVQTRAFKYLLEYDPRIDLERMTIPVLALFGGLDLQVPASLNVSSLQTALDAAGNRDFAIEILPGANHLFQAAILGTVEEYAILDKEFVPGFLDTISDWIQNRE